MIRESSVVVPLPDESAVGEARRVARRCAGELGLDAVTSERAAIAATEAARNAVRHGGGGELVLRALGPDDHPGLELLALDRGPGIADVAAAMRDGHSTAGTAGQGLGALARLASRFDLWTSPGRGTAVLVRVRAGAEPAEALELGAVCATMPREEACGDGWAFARTGDRAVFLVVDGLGHGMPAAAAAREAKDAFRRSVSHGVRDVVEACHRALRATRGAALAVAAVHLATGAVEYAGVGNIAGAIVGSGGTRRLVSLAGIAGHEVRKVQVFAYDWPADALLVLQSDGLATRWTLDDYPGLSRHDPALVAGVLYRDHGRPRDDTTVLVARRMAP